MPSQVPINQRVHHLKSDCLSWGEVFAQSFSLPLMGLRIALSENGRGLSLLLGLVEPICIGSKSNPFVTDSAFPLSLTPQLSTV